MTASTFATTAEADATLQAISRSQAIIEFKPDGTIITANPNFLNVMGYSLAEIEGRHHSMFVEPAQSHSPAYRQFWSALADGEFRADEFKRVGKHGREVWIQATYNPVLGPDGKVQKVIKVAADITAQKMRSAEFEGQINAINKSNAVIEFDLNGVILDANANFLAALGYSLAEIKGQHHRMFVEPSYRESPAYRQFWQDLSSGHYQSGEFKRVGKGGREVWIQASYNPIFDPSGKPCKVIKFAADVTGQIRARNAVTEAINGSAAAVEELSASVSEIALNMSRSRDAATKAVDQTAETKRYMETLSSAARAMGGVIDIINTITSQINLLALNATIESARAGQAGRGFAVVAGEVKALAGQARSATEKISGEIENMRSVTAQVSGALAQIGAAIESASSFVASTAAAAEEQSVATREIAANIQNAAKEANAMTRAA